MFKKSYLTSILLIAILILGACGTTPEENNSTESTTNEQEPTEEQENNDSESENEENIVEEDDELVIEEEEEEDTLDQDTREENEGKENDTNMESSEDKEEEENGLLTNAKHVDSDAQDYSIQVLPAYTLTSEEPGKDALFLTEDGNIFMRIETMPFDQESYDFFKENTLDLLEGVKADGKTVTDSATLPTGENINDSVGYTVETNESILSGFVFEKDGLLVRLTIFDTLTEEHFSNFLQMGETITNK